MAFQFARISTSLTTRQGFSCRSRWSSQQSIWLCDVCLKDLPQNPVGHRPRAAKANPWLPLRWTTAGCFRDGPTTCGRRVLHEAAAKASVSASRAPPALYTKHQFTHSPPSPILLAGPHLTNLSSIRSRPGLPYLQSGAGGGHTPVLSSKRIPPGSDVRPCRSRRARSRMLIPSGEFSRPQDTPVSVRQITGVPPPRCLSSRIALESGGRCGFVPTTISMLRSSPNTITGRNDPRGPPHKLD